MQDDQIERGVRNLEGQGFRVALGRHIRAAHGGYAGTVEERLEDLHGMFAHREVRAIWSARGGSGCLGLLPRIDYALIRRHPKILVGYSDITALHLALWRRARLITFHGPVASSTFSDFSIARWRAMLMEPGVETVLPIAAENLQRSDSEPQYAPRTFREGRAHGRLLGGNLSMVAAMVGTPFGARTAGCLLFLEEIGEEPYRIDRLFWQLANSGALGEAAGFALGIFQRCEAKPGDASLTLAEVLESHLAARRQPSMYGLSFGHISQQVTIPVGVNARLDTAERTLTLLEAAVT